jgi:repressor LexA
LAPPTYRELCREFGWSSTGTARDHLKALIRKGALDSGTGGARGAHLRRVRVAETAILPLRGRIIAGQPVVSDEVVDDEIAIPSFWRSGNGFVLRVSGDSMEGAGILTILLCGRQVSRSGDIVAATVSETTLKRLERRDRGWI